jgi:hypothetical protein
VVHSRQRWFGMLGVLGFSVAIPTAAFAVTAMEPRGTFRLFELEVDGHSVVQKRIPANSDNDFKLPERADGRGTFQSDITGCPTGDHGYNAYLIHDLKFRPDERVFQVQRSYCAKKSVLHPGWPDGHYHINHNPTFFPQQDGSGHVQVDW